MNRKHPACQCGDNARDLGLSRHEVPTDDIAQVMSRRQCHERLSASRGVFGGIRYGTKPADQYWSRGLCCRPRPTCASQALKDVTLPRAESTHGRPCPKWNSNPHALAGMRLRSARVYQFRHSGTSTKTTKLLAPTSQATSRYQQSDCQLMRPTSAATAAIVRAFRHGNDDELIETGVTVGHDTSCQSVWAP